MSRVRSVVVGAFALASLGAALAAIAACENQKGTYVYRGRQYDPEKKCLGDTRALDILELDKDPALCAPVCLVNRAYDGGLGIYVSTTCPPYPPEFDTSGTNPHCRDAVFLADSRDPCLPDAGPDASDGAVVEDAAPTDASLPDATDASDAGAPDAGDTDAGDAAITDASDAG